MSRRLFISLDIENRELRDELQNFQERISDLGLTNPTSPDNFHVTLNFIGDVPEDRIDSLEEDLHKVEFPSFEFTVKCVGVFPKPDFIKVVWAGVGEGKSELCSLADRIRSSIDPGLVQDREFHPHITLLRVKKIGREDKDELQEVLKEHDETIFGTQEASSFKLKESVLESEGAKHRTVSEFDLK